MHDFKLTLDLLIRSAKLATARIETLIAERDALIHDRDRWAAEAQVNTSPIVAGLTADNARLRAELTKAADSLDWADAHLEDAGVVSANVRYGARDARAALTAAEGNQMSDDDLIRRGDALQAINNALASNPLVVSPIRDEARALAGYVVSALPAVQPRVKPLEWREISGFEDRWFADADIGVYSVSDPTGFGRWRWQWHIHASDRDWDVLLDQSNQELARAFPTREDAIAAVEGHRKARILSALINNTGKETK